MKILVVSDEESPYLWDHYQPGRLDGIDLIISCGDLSPFYLSFLVTMCTAPVLYVHGNHDGRYEKQPPEGCECIEDRIVTFRGLRILGLGGSMRYSPGPHQYTDEQMEKRVRRLRRQLKKAGGVDIIVSHSPVRGIGDEEGLPHRGFEVFRKLLDEQKPRYWFYGHVHMRYSAKNKRVLVHEGTQLVNACEKYVVEIEE